MKTALVTGANKGIGFDIAKELLRDGYLVLVGARDNARGLAAVEALRMLGDAELLLIDVADLDSIHAAVETIKANYPDLALLVNNAGIPGDMHKVGWEFSPQELLDTHLVDFIGPFELSKGLLPVIIANQGKILNVSIPIEPHPRFNAFAYQTAKAPLNVMTKAWGLSFTQNDVPVEIFAVMPGAVSTDLNGNIQGDFVKTAEQAAKLIVDFTRDGVNHNGHVINFDGNLANYN
jgi:NAD(P)-dependent dehydrogenase (short-subunit alcohol dehydrogenase family)